MPFSHASCIVTGEETQEHGRWLREFWLTPGHRDWVEVDYERQEGPRTRPRPHDRLLVLRGPLGELIGQEFVHGFENPERLLALQETCDRLRAEEDERNWTAERRERIANAQETLDAAVYAERFRFGVVVVAFTDEAVDWLRGDFESMNLAEGTFVDLTGRVVAERQADLSPDVPPAGVARGFRP